MKSLSGTEPRGTPLAERRAKMKSRPDAGYSIAEMLAVVAIIGMLTLVTVPAFLTFRNSNKMRSSVRQFTTDIRSARQRAITRSHQVLMTYEVTASGAPAASYKRRYVFYEGNLSNNSTTWTPVDRTLSGIANSAAVYTLSDIVYFPANTPATLQSFDDTLNCTAGGCSNGTDNRPELIFFPDGHARMPSGAQLGQITIKTDAGVPTKQYAIQVSPSGSIRAVAQ